MARTRNIEILVGAFMAAGFVALFFLAMRVSNLSAGTVTDGYLLKARFDNVGSLKERSPVTLAGVRIGRVESIGFDKATYEALVTLRIGREYDNLPTDTFAMRDGDTIGHTQSALVLEQMIGQFLFNKAAETSQ